MILIKIRSKRKFGFGEKDLFDQKVAEEHLKMNIGSTKLEHPN